MIPVLLAFVVLTAAPLEGRIDALVAETMERGHLAGVSVFVSQRGKTLLEKGYGKASIEHGVLVTPQTVFHLASITKHFTAAAVLFLAQQGKLSLDAPISRYLSGGPPAWSGIHVRDLLNHTAGFRSFTDLPDWTEASERLDHPRDELFRLIAQQPQEFAPRSGWKYNNAAVWLAGLVIEKVTGKAYGEFMRDQIFAPLGLATARLCEGSEVVPHLAEGYFFAGGAAHPEQMSWTAPYAAGGMCATAADVAAFERALGEGRLIDRAALEEMRAPTRLSDGGAVDYGLGTRLGEVEGRRVIGHTGSSGGYRNAFHYYPGDDLTVVVLTNSGGRGAFELAGRISRVVLQLPEAKLHDLPVPPELCTALTGTFATSEAVVPIFARGDRLFFRRGTHEVPLLYQGGRWFAIDGDTAVRFDMRQGSVDGSLYVGGLLLDYGSKVP